MREERRNDKRYGVVGGSVGVDTTTKETHATTQSFPIAIDFLANHAKINFCPDASKE